MDNAYKNRIIIQCMDEYVNKIAQRDIPLHSVLLMKNNEMVYERYMQPYDAKALHRMYSISKSVTALAIMFLIQEGRLGFEDHIVDYFKDKTEGQVHPYIAAMTIEDMLTMRSCYDSTTYKLSGMDDWVKSFFISAPTHYPGTYFSYDTSAAHVLAALVERISGRSMLDYLREKVLDDIGFSKEAYFLKDPMGVSMGGSGLMAAPRDILCIAQFIMNNGKYCGRSYLGEKYISRLVEKQADNYAKSASFEEMQGYGSYFWRTTHNGYVMYGMGGQLALCLPDKNIILVTTADTQGRQGGVGILYDEFWENVYDRMDGYKLDCECDCEITNESGNILKSNVLAVSSDGGVLPQIFIKNIVSDMKNDINGKEIILDDNAKHFRKFRLEIGEDEGTLYFENDNGSQQIGFGIGKNKEVLFPYYGHRALVSGGFVSQDTFLIFAQIIDEYVGKVFLNFSFRDGYAGIMLRKIEESYYKEFDLYSCGKIQRD